MTIPPETTFQSWQLTKDGPGGDPNYWKRLPKPAIIGLDAPQAYIPQQSTVDAVNVALALGQPLLVTGEPGCGKTALASWVAHRLGLGEPFCFQTRSTSTSRDLFYIFDALGRFNAAQNTFTTQTTDARQYITYTGLGEVIMRALGRDEAANFVASEQKQGYPVEPTRSVLLIDEIDKAPRDFPNDVLGEIANFSFRIPEIGGIQVTAPRLLLPIVIVTSNMERALPDAFLRRCVYHHMAFPDPETLEKIVYSRVKSIPAASPLVTSAVRVVTALRDMNMQKPPGTAELLAFVLTLRSRGFGPSQKLEDWVNWIEDAMLTLVKTREDQDKARSRLPALASKLKSD